MLMIVGQIHNEAEADELVLITRNFIIASRAKELARSFQKR